MAKLRIGRDASCADLFRAAGSDGLGCLQVCFLNCLVWNYWEECLEHKQMPINPNTPADFELYKVKVWPPEKLLSPALLQAAWIHATSGNQPGQLV